MCFNVNKMRKKLDLVPFAGANSLMKGLELYEFLSEQMFLRPEIGLSSREMNSWEKEGLIENRRGEEQRWRRFDFIEFVWLRLVMQMREIGLPIETIRKAKGWIMEQIPIYDLMTLVTGIPQVVEEVLKNADKEDLPELKKFLKAKDWKKVFADHKITALQLFVVQVILKKTPISFAIFRDGDVLPVFHGVYDDYETKLWEEPHAMVSVSLIIKEFLASDLAPARIGKLHLLDENETKLMEMIHSGEYESVKVNFREGKMKSLDLVKSQDTKRKIVDVLADAKYQDITIKTHKGMISTIQNTIKIQLD